MRPWQRSILAIVGIGAAYLMWRFPVHGVGVIVLTVCALWLGRSAYRTKLARNPLGEDRDFSITPVVTTMLKAVGLFAAAIVWAMLLTYAVRYKYLPDNWLGVGIVVGPSLVLLGIGAAFLLKALSRFQLGGQR